MLLQMCLPPRWAILSVLHPADRNGDRVSKYVMYMYQHELDFTGVEWPASLKEVDKVRCSVLERLRLHCVGDYSCVFVSARITTPC